MLPKGLLVISVVSTNRYASEMSVSNEYADNLRTAENRLQEICENAVNDGWELLNHGDWMAWLRDVKHPDRISFVCISPGFPVK